MRLQEFDITDPRQDVEAAIRQDGACIIHNILRPDTCEMLLEDFQPYLDAMVWGEDELGYREAFYGEQTKRLHGLFSKSEKMVSVLTHPSFLALAEHFLCAGGRARDIRLSNTELMVLNQGQGHQLFHRDAGSWRRAQSKEQPEEILISANIALTEFTEFNGATRVVPGSHLWAEGREPDVDEICLATMPRGAALIYSGNVIHSGGENQTA